MFNEAALIQTAKRMRTWVAAGVVIPLMVACASHPVTNISIAQALAAPDGSVVVVTGAVVQQVDKEHLLLRDSTGQINVTVDDDILGKVKFAPDAEVRVTGKIDRDSRRSLLIAKSVQVVK